MLFVNRKFLNSLLHFLPLHWETAWQQHCSQGNGLWPTHDWDGREFSHNHHPRWFRLGGSELCGGWGGVMDGVQGDQDFLHKIFQFKRHLDWLVMCFFWFYSLWPWIPFFFWRCLKQQNHETRIVAFEASICMSVLWRC